MKIKKINGNPSSQEKRLGCNTCIARCTRECMLPGYITGSKTGLKCSCKDECIGTHKGNLLFSKYKMGGDKK